MKFNFNKDTEGNVAAKSKINKSTLQIKIQA